MAASRLCWVHATILPLVWGKSEKATNWGIYVFFPDPVLPTMTITWFSLKAIKNSYICANTGSLFRVSRIFLAGR
ncbi:hypothetical protein H1R20_g974, partial [Candolleomyces eurysporus]